MTLPAGGTGGTIPPPNLTGVLPAPPAQPAVPVGAPAQVQGLQVSGQAPGAVLSWQPVAGATYYELHMLYDAELIGATSGLATDPGQVNGATGYYWQITATTATVTAIAGSMVFEVAACNAVGCGPWSSRVAVPYQPYQSPVFN